MRFKKLIGIPTLSVVLLFFSFVALSSQQESKISTYLYEALCLKGEEGRYTIWIYLKDKGPDFRSKLDQLEKTLSPRILKRRIRQCGRSQVVDIYDLPVDEQYVINLKPHMERLRHCSRWLNAVSAEVKGTEIGKISRLPYIRCLDTVKSYVFQEPENRGNLEILSLSHESQGHALDYGASFNQLNQINVPALHDMGYSGKGVLICMLDSGFNNLEHQALDHLDIRATWDFVNNDANVDDEPGQMSVGNHGTNTLGTIAGFFPGELIGPAYGASFILGKTENTEWERHIEEDHWVAASEWAEQMGVDIISSSLGYRDEFTHGEGNYIAENMDGRTAVVTLGANIAASKGVLIVNSAGNEGRKVDLVNTIIAPSDSPDVLAAGAVDTQGYRTDFSSFGPSADGRIKPDVMAQGSHVYTATADNLTSFVSVAGTSFSCPLVAGAAGLVLEVNPTWSNRDIMTALKNTAAKAHNPDNKMGWGILDALGAAFYTIKSIHPPRRFAVESLENNYIFFTQFVDRLTWEADSRNSGQVSAYRIYERQIGGSSTAFTILAEVGVQTLSFERRGRLPGEDFIYKIVSVGTTGEESDPDYTRY